MISLKHIMNEGNNGKYTVPFRNVLPGGKEKDINVKFIIYVYDGSIIFMAENSKELDKLMEHPLYKYPEDISALIAGHLQRKNKFKFVVDTSYKGAGYAVKLDLNDILTSLK